MKLTESKLRQIIEEEIFYLSEGKHDSNLVPQDNLTIDDIEAGQFVSFPYIPKGGGDERRRNIFVVANAPDYIHGLDIDYLSEKDLVQFFAHIHADLDRTAQQMMNKMFDSMGILHAAHVAQPRSFYEDVMKKSRIGGINRAYRQYIKTNIGEGLIKRFRYKSSLDGNINSYY
jgi:hypothetical protein